MTSTNIHVGYGDSDKKSSKVLKPPGGGTSDIFGGDAPSTPRSVKNHMASNIFGPSDGMNRNGGDSGRRPQQSVDSHNRLFGEMQRPNTPAKNYMKSNLPIGGETASKNGAAAAANSIHQNGNNENGSSIKQNGKTNGHSERNGNHGNMNGNGYKAEMNGGDANENDVDLESECCDVDDFTNNDKTGYDSICSTPRSIKSLSLNIEDTNNYDIDGLQISDDKTNNSNNNIDNNLDDDCLSSKNSHHTNINDDYTNDEQQSNHNNNNNNSNNNQQENNKKSSSSSASLKLKNNEIYKSKSPRPFTPRNPVTGCGIDLPSDRPRKMGVRRDGNPVTGEGYKAAGAEINTTVPSLNGTNMVINKNRIPPGGYSSGLW